MPLSIPGPQGPIGKSLLNGTSAPAANLGSDGDFYLRTSTMTIYGPKSNGAWGSGTSLVGPQGDSGAAGPSSAGFSALPPGARQGVYYPIPASGVVGTYQLLNSYIYFTPFAVNSTPSPALNTLALEVTTGANNSVLNLAIYNAGADLLPSSSWLALGTAAGTAGRKTFSINTDNFTGGLFYLACWVQGTGSPTVRAINSGGGPIPYMTAPGTNNWAAVCIAGQSVNVGDPWPENPLPSGGAQSPRYDFSLQ